MKNIIFFMFLYSIAIILKPLRYYFILSSEKLIAYSKGFYIGNFLNLFIPFRIGDISRIFMFTSVINKSENLKLILIEKILDLVLMIFFVALVFIFSKKLFLVSFYLKYILLILFLFLILIIYFNLLRQTSVLLISAFAWFCEGLAFAYFMSLVLNLEFLDGFSFMPIATLSTLIPSAPGYIGVINLATISWAEFLEVSNLSIGSISFEIYILTWLCTFAFGLFMIMSVKREVIDFLISFFNRKIK